MRTLVIDCATEACSVALFEGGALVAGDWHLLGRGHAEALVPMIAALPDKGRADRIAVSLGPGSFTGLRVGLAAARALGLAWKCPVLGYPTLSLVAAQALDASKAEEVLVCMTGGHGEWFVQGFDRNLVTTAPLASLPPAEAAAAPQVLVAGTKASELVELRRSGEALAIHPDARSFGLLDFALLTSDIALIYGRAPDAQLPQQKPKPEQRGGRTGQVAGQAA
ncbi:tRNA (adenosine(37)-N6)-threonylcarbamoyltransferase complex dimerization subunit type 1 TsaB [Novosphingobium sp.]|uniref:tRNA (adenosine(37)-N6)-threonylcarbamoyltransferase complex dimerization subunit type 1 TsaB n=1 Tax=Novosphingobium sp. TaxID=1874826 RepID=UPI00286E520B|nr:tRNA (adenosine(37)-N6)-threonylcarbamoyltransferase complex dimerization subunit type 1 TsaB [Novosphingobium sp.]